MPYEVLNAEIFHDECMDLTARFTLDCGSREGSLVAKFSRSVDGLSSWLKCKSATHIAVNGDVWGYANVNEIINQEEGE